MADQIRQMLTAAYRHLGIHNETALSRWVTEALEYLQADREHYIEVVLPDLPEYRITEKYGIVCLRVPLAQAIKTETYKDYVRQETTVLLLTVTEDAVKYVLEQSHSRLYSNPANNTYAFPTYRYTTLQEVPETLDAHPPRKIAPIATPKERDAFGMIFTAIAKFSQHLTLNSIPRKTERAMQFARYAPEETLTLNGKSVTGKLIPLAQQDPMWDQMRKDHTYIYTKILCLLITGNTNQYVMKTHHRYQYFRKVICDDAPGGCSYEPTGDKQEITYEPVKLEDISETFYPSFNR